MPPGEDGKEEAGFILEGRTYPIPTLDTFTMDESIVLYDYCGLGLEDFMETEDPEEQAAHRQRLKHPGFMKALLHIAYLRGNPNAKPGQVKAVVGQVTFVGALEQILAAEEEADEESPPVTEPTSVPVQSLRTSSDGSSESSGVPSTNGSEEPAAHPAPSTGTTN